MSNEPYCGYVIRHGGDSDEVCGRPARLVDRGDGTYLCEKHAAALLDQQPERRFGQIDRTIDRMVIEHLFGGRVCERDSHEHCPRGERHMAAQEMRWFAEFTQEAESVIERLREGGIDLRARPVAGWLPRDWRMLFADPERDPLAICVAALIAKGVEI